jgi:hypothetical protein
MVEKQQRSEIPLKDAGGNKAVTNVMDLPGDICPNGGQVTFVKRTVGGGDEIYISVGNESVSPVNYLIILTDSLIAYTWDRGLYPGTIKAIGSVNGSLLSVGATYEREG